ncbi:DedA family protein [Candidatus Daviesbacteria bacterium]|nr:DedA family protein [Candidatus Daviesbacteria bacterium]
MEKNTKSSFLAKIFQGDLILPLLLLTIYIVFLIIARGYFPTASEVVKSFGHLYESFGYQIIFTSALLEASVLVNFFVPGTLGMAMGAIFARTGQVDLTLSILSASSGVVLGYSLDYILGYYGFGEVVKKLGYKNFLQTSEDQLNKLGYRGLILGFINPTIASFLSLAAGTAGMKFYNFFTLSLISTLFWMSIWGVIFYIFGEILLLLLIRYTILFFIIVIAGIFLMRFWKTKSLKRQN